MIVEILIRVLMLLPSSAPDRLQSTAPDYLTHEDAVEHLWTARVVSWAFDVDPNLLLAIAHHESHYERATVTQERVGVSCGVMTPTPGDRASCAIQTRSLVSGYIAGARHLRGWMIAGGLRSRREALIGYASGYALIDRCRRGPVLRHHDHGDDLCRIPDVFEFRARLIQQGVHGVRPRS